MDREGCRGGAGAGVGAGARAEAEAEAWIPHIPDAAGKQIPVEPNMQDGGAV